MTLDLSVLRQQFIEAAVSAVNETAERTAERARDKAPVRKVFSGGRQTVRFKTAAEVEGDRALRAKLGLGPEIAATPEAARRLIRAGKNPTRSAGFFGTYKLPGGEPGGIEEFGFATTLDHPRGGRSKLGRNRANIFSPKRALTSKNTNVYFGRIVGKPIVSAKGKLKGLDLTQLAYGDESRLTARGRYELKSGRALSAIARVKGGGTVGTRHDDTAFLGGSLRESIRVEPASAEQFPVISASVVAGGGRVTYAKHQELGTRHNPAHPFLRPALAVAEDELPVQLERELRWVAGR